GEARACRFALVRSLPRRGNGGVAAEGAARARSVGGASRPRARAGGKAADRAVATLGVVWVKAVDEPERTELLSIRATEGRAPDESRAQELGHGGIHSRHLHRGRDLRGLRCERRRQQEQRDLVPDGALGRGGGDWLSA